MRRRFSSYSRCQPPLTDSSTAIPESESPRATVYPSRRVGTLVGDAAFFCWIRFC